MSTKKQFREILDHFDTAMLVTRSSEGMIRARPMLIADHEDGNDELWFVTSLDTQVVDELLADDLAAVTMQGTSRYLSISGRATVIKDQSKASGLWQMRMTPWFKKDDPELVLIRFVPEEAEYWDESGMHKVSYLFKAIKAVVTGKELEPADMDEEHGRIHL